MYPSPRNILPHQLASMWPDLPCGCKDWAPVLVRPRVVTVLPWTSISFSIPIKCVVVSTSGEVHPQCQAIRRGHSRPRLSSKEVKMMTSTLSCGFDVCYVSNVVVWPSSRHQNEGGRYESTNVLSGLPVDLNGISWLTLASIKIKNKKREMYLNWNFCGKEDFRHTWINALYQYIVSSPLYSFFF